MPIFAQSLQNCEFIFPTILGGWMTKTFWGNVGIGEADDCWEWQGAIHRGYGVYQGKRAHRVSYEDRVGIIPEGGMICHLCNNKACVNPDHLYVGTAKENAIDLILCRRGVS